MHSISRVIMQSVGSRTNMGEQTSLDKGIGKCGHKDKFWLITWPFVLRVEGKEFGGDCLSGSL